MPPAADPACGWIAVFCLVAFLLELVLASVARPDYFLRFYFWIDLVATISMLFDVPAIVTWLDGNQVL